MECDYKMAKMSKTCSPSIYANQKDIRVFVKDEPTTSLLNITAPKDLLDEIMLILGKFLPIYDDNRAYCESVNVPLRFRDLVRNENILTSRNFSRPLRIFLGLGMCILFLRIYLLNLYI